MFAQSVSACNGALPRAGRLRGGAQLDADDRLGDPFTGVAASFTSEAVAVLADDRDVRLGVQVGELTAKRFDKERARREMNDSRPFGVSSVELHAASIPYRPDDGEGPGAVCRRRQADHRRSRTSNPEEARAGRNLGVWRPESGGEKWFCGECGSALFGSNPAHPESIGIRMGTFDDDPGIRPSVRQFVAYAAPWEPIPDDGLPRFPESRHASDGSR